jgi:P-type Cu2+ transporter
MAIVDGGLENFYQYRAQTPSLAPVQLPSGLGSAKTTQWDIYNLPEVQAEFVVPLGENLKQANLLLEGISCAACSWLIETHLKQLPGVTSVTIHLNSHRCNLVWNGLSPLSELMAALAAIGYLPRPATDEQQQLLISKENRIALFRIGVAGFGMMQAMMVAVGLYTGASGFWLDFLRWLSMLVATPVVFFSAWPFFQAAWRSLLSRQLVMDVPVALAIGLAYFASVWATLMSTGEVYFESVSMFAFFLLVGRYVELRARHSNRLAFGNLAQLMPLTACCLTQGDSGETEQQRALSLLKVNDLVLVRPGETFPCDGLIVSGDSSVEEALLTGESQPIAKQVGDSVIGGTLNQQSPLRIRVTAIGAATQLSAIERIATQAAQDKPQQVLLADKIARFFIARLLLLTVLVLGFWCWYQPEKAFWVMLSVLVVTCPCALALAMPAALSAATANLRKRGFLVARGHVVEALNHINHVVLDKTGTLTQGSFQVKTVVILAPDTALKLPTLTQGTSEQEAILALAAVLERGSNHPLASAFRPFDLPRYAHGLSIAAGKQVTAAGVEAEVNARRYRLGSPAFAGELCSGAVATEGDLSPPSDEFQWLLLASTAGPLAWIGLQDELRSDAQSLVAQLQHQGLKLSLLSGDHPWAVARLAHSLGITQFVGGAQPNDKLAYLQRCQAEGDRVLMLGDGINDIPVLAGANVSVAMACASDLAQTRADAVLLNNRLMVLWEAIAIARATEHIIKQNLRFALLYNLCALPLAVAGLVAPWAAALGMTTSSLIVIFNALRLMRA